MVLKLVFLFLALLRDLGLPLLFHLLVVDLVLAKSLFESARRHLIDKVPLILKRFLLFGELYRF